MATDQAPNVTGVAQVTEAVPVRKPRKMKLTTLVILILSIMLVGTFFFGFLYLQRSVPSGLNMLVTRAKKPLNQPPSFLGHLQLPPDGKFSNPLGVAVAEDGRIFVADSGDSEIKVFASDGKFAGKFGKHGKGPGELEYPTDLAVRAGKVYVADFKNNRVAVFNTDGAFQKNLTHGPGNSGISPLAVDVDEKGYVYLADRSHRVIVLDDQGRFVRTFGEGGGGDGQMSYPNGITVAKDGTIYVSDSGNGRIEYFDGSGRFLGKIEGLVNPRGIALDQGGRLYVVDPLSHTVTVYNSEKKLLFTFGSRGVDNGQFNFPNGVAVDNQGRILVTDRENDRVCIWNY
ncbi:MAG: 6-bladed beta-propeller [Actinobacteria bacterium]|nr:6-bladed beta-propeller [Actinomycetota bacterium]